MDPISRPYRIPWGRFPALRVALVFMLGITMSQAMGLSLQTGLTVLGLLLATTWILEYVGQRRLHQGASVAAMIVYHLVLFTAGWLRASGLQPTTLSQNGPPAWELAAFEGEEMTAVATVQQVRTRSTGVTVWLEADTLWYRDIPVWIWPTGLLLRWEADATPPEMGDRIRFAMRLRSHKTVRNPFEFDYGAWLRRQGVAFQGTVTTLLHHKTADGFWSWLVWRRNLDRLIRQGFSPEEVPVARALLIGQKGDVESDERAAFARSGLSHLMAVSGLHVGFIVAPLWLLIPFVWGTRWGRWLGFAAICGFLLCYAGITGFSASVVRASVMAVLAAYARVFRHPREPLNLMALAALVILAADPTFLWDLGFQLSFCAVGILLIAMPTVQRALPDRLNRKPWSWISGLVTVSVVVQIGLFPILARGFGEFSVAGPVANLVGIPATQVMILWSMAALPLSALLPDFAPWIMAPANWAARLLRIAAEGVGGWGWSSLYVAFPSPWIFPFWLSALLAVASLGKRGLQWKMICASLAFLVLWTGDTLRRSWNRPLLEVLFFDVGQGDGALVRTRDGHAWLIDTGVLGLGADSGKFTIVPVLRRLGIRRLDGIVLSHPHADHIGGMLSIIESIPVDTLYEADFPTSSAVVAGYQRAAKRLGIPVVKLRHGRRLPFGETVRAYVLGPVSPDLHHDPNTASVVLQVRAGEVSFLFTGDADMEAEQEISGQYGNTLRSTVLKAGHHGSRTSSGPSFLEAVRPEHIVVSLAWSNRYRHPHPEAVARLQATGAQMHFTSRQGAVWMATDGRRLWHVDWKPPP